MAFLEWSPLFSVGVSSLDDEHRRLVSLLNDFQDACAAGRGPQAAFGALNALVRYAEEHFAHEQDLMDEHGYPERLRHRAEHERFLRRVFELAGEVDADAERGAEEVLEFIKTWLLEHVLGSDRRYGAFFAERGVL